MWKVDIGYGRPRMPVMKERNDRVVRGRKKLVEIELHTGTINKKLL